MKKTFGSAFALIMVALFTVAPTSPATAYPGGIHLHIAGKVGQKAVGSTVIFGAEGVTQAPQTNSTYSSVGGGFVDAYVPTVPNACLWLVQGNKYGEMGYALEPKISGWTSECQGGWGESARLIQIPASGSLADQIPLPDLPAGQYELWFGAFMSYAEYGTAATLGYAFTIGADGTFTAIGPACGGLCVPASDPLPMEFRR